jgi:flavin-dependent dehydrogenase
MKIAIAGAGVAGSYLMNRLPNEYKTECFEMRPEDKWWTVCAWGTSEPFITDMVKKTGLNFEDYVLHKGKRMIVEANGNTVEIKLKGLVTYDKHRLTHDMLKGHVVHWGKQIKSVDGGMSEFDVVIDATGLQRNLLPKIEGDVVIPSVEYMVKSKELPYDDFYIKPYRGLCVTSETLVMANPGAKAILEVQAGEKVLTKTGWTPVGQVSSRDYSGSLFKITPFLCGFPVGLTPDHLVWVLDRRTGMTGWKPARAIRECHSKSEGDYVAMPIPRHEAASQIRISDYVDGILKNGKIRPKGRNQFGSVFAYRQALTNKVLVTQEFGEFIGYYISEGNAFNNGIILSNYNKSVYLRMKKLGESLFGIKAKEYYPHQVQFNSVILKRLFISLFGEGAHFKKIPLIALGFPRAVKVAMLRSLFIGDGGKERRAKYDYLSYTTRSKTLAIGLWQLLLNVGIVGSVAYSKSSRAYRIRIYGSQLKNLGDIFGRLVLSKALRPSRKYIVRDDMLYFAVRKVARRQVEGVRVHDLSTNGSYVTSFLVHNSGYWWFFPLGDGMAHVGAGDFRGQYKGELESFISKYKCEVIRKIGRPVRVLPPAYCQPFESGKAIGVGESIGSVYPLLGEGIIPSMQCVDAFVDTFPDREAYSREVLDRFRVYTKVYKFIKAKLDGKFSLLSQFPNLLSVYFHIKSNEKRYGLEVKLGDFLKVIRV